MADLTATQMSEKHDWETPQTFFDKLDENFCFMLDVAADATNTKCGRWYGPQGEHKDALDPALLWPTDGVLWMNPPYQRGVQNRFIAKAVETAMRGGWVLALLPARTDTKMFHSLIWDTAVNRPYPWVRDLRFLKGRLMFVGAESKAPFPSMTVLFGRDQTR